jgi:hypothetical protein
MNTQKRKQTNKTRNASKENTWSNIQQLVNARKYEKKTKIAEKFSEVIEFINKKRTLTKSEPIEKIINVRVPENILPGQIFEIYIDGILTKVQCPLNSKSGNKITIKIKYTRNVQNEINFLIKLRKTYKIMYETGKYYGYPNCCINDFVLRMCNDQPCEPIQELAGKYSGYVPCIKCSKKIDLHRFSIEQIIKNRKCKSKFPSDDEHGGFKACNKHTRMLFLKNLTFDELDELKCGDCIDLLDNKMYTHICNMNCTCKNNYHH